MIIKRKLIFYASNFTFPVLQVIRQKDHQPPSYFGFSSSVMVIQCGSRTTNTAIVMRMGAQTLCICPCFLGPSPPSIFIQHNNNKEKEAFFILEG